MDTAKNAPNKIICWDCKKELKITNGEIEDGKRLVYNNNGEKIEIFKCNDCFQKNPRLTNYQQCEVYSRIVGYLRPIQQWNYGKQQEFKERKTFKIAEEYS